MRGLDEWLPPAYLGLRLGGGYRNRLTDRAGLHDTRPQIRGKHPTPAERNLSRAAANPRAERHN